MKDQDDFYFQQNEPIKSCLFALHDIILKYDAGITTSMKYGMPFFCYKDKMFCYLWVHKKFKQPYIGLVDGKRLNHEDLLIEKRSRMKIMLFDAHQDLPLSKINGILQQAVNLLKLDC